MGGDFNRIGTIRSLDFRIHRNRLFTFLNMGNTNGSAAVGVVYNRLSGSDNDIIVSRGSLSGDLRLVGDRLNMMFRGSILSVTLAICSGLRDHTTLCNVVKSRFGTHLTRLTGLLSFRGLLGQAMKGLSNNRQEEVSITETLLPGPGVLMLSRPAANLSPRAHGAL